MKKIGILGGMSWESSMIYYRIMNETTKERCGKTHSANCLMYSFDFFEIEQLQHDDKWDQLTRCMIDEAQNLKRGGAEFIVIATNTMHLMAEAIEAATKLKVLHIAEATGKAIKKQDLQKVLLLGTKFTMNSTFYADILAPMGIEIITPDDEDQNTIHEIIYNKLILGIFDEPSRKIYADIIEKMALRGAEGVILGCTEIPLLITAKDVSIPVFDTTTLHAVAAIDFALSED